LQPGITMKKLVWTLLVAVVTTGAAASALRLLNLLWRKALNEDPPERPGWASWIVGKPVHAGIKQAVEP